MDETELKPELSENAWIESESIRLLMKPRSWTTGFSAFAMLFMALQVYGHIKTLWIAAWLLLSLSVLVYRLRMKLRFESKFLTSAVEVQSAFISRNKQAWTLNAFSWGVSGWLFFTDIPIQNKYIGAIILTFVGFVAIHNLNTNRVVSNQFINTLMGIQLVGAAWFIAYVWQFKGVSIQYVHVISLVVIWIVLHIFNNRFHDDFRRNLTLQFRNNSLIRSLSLKSEQLEHEKQVAMNANEVIQRFYTSAAHDIRQPVYALKLYSEIAVADQEQMSNLLPKITDSCIAINNLFDSLFDFEQVNSGHVNVVHQTVDIDELIDDLEYQFKPLAMRKNLEFRTNIISGYLQTDQLLVKRILTCFISNAVKFTAQGGILVTVRQHKTAIVFEVWDTGIGIDPVHLEHVFEEFYKVGDYASKDEGFGLGLSVVKRLSAYAENSTISVNSRLGKGSVFRFSLPVKIYSPPYIPSRFDTAKSLPLVLDFEL
jgi:signal transduction histidine kinase